MSNPFNFEKFGYKPNRKPVVYAIKEDKPKKIKVPPPSIARRKEVQELAHAWLNKKR